MNRKKFLKSCGLACAGFLGGITLLESCASTGAVTGNISGDDLIVPLKVFEIRNGEKIYHKKYVVIENSLLKYPVCIYRQSESDYQALWMRCTHQGTELQVFGSRLQCPAHGSEFSDNGEVQAGPASQPLRKFPVTILNGQLRISLKRV